MTKIRPTGKRVGKNRVWLCRCECGKEFETHKHSWIKSCGCRWVKHGNYVGKNPLAGVHKQLKQRVLNPNNKDYKYFGGKGVKLCEEWTTLYGFKRWAYMAGYVPGLTIDRIDHDGDYEPGNCIWITRQENTRRRNEKTNQQAAQPPHPTGTAPRPAKLAVGSGRTAGKGIALAGQQLPPMEQKRPLMQQHQQPAN